MRSHPLSIPTCNHQVRDLPRWQLCTFLMVERIGKSMDLGTRGLWPMPRTHRRAFDVKVLVKQEPSKLFSGLVAKSMELSSQSMATRVESHCTCALGILAPNWWIRFDCKVARLRKDGLLFLPYSDLIRRDSKSLVITKSKQNGACVSNSSHHGQAFPPMPPWHQ